MKGNRELGREGAKRRHMKGKRGKNDSYIYPHTFKLQNECLSQAFPLVFLLLGTSMHAAVTECFLQRVPTYTFT